MKAALELWKGDRFVQQGLMQEKYRGKNVIVFPFSPNLSTLAFSRDLTLFGRCQHTDTTKLREHQRMIQEHWLFYRVATNVLFDPGHINLAIFYSYDTVKDVVADFKVIFETQTSFKILVK